MKFAIRDDDLNYFFNHSVIENNYKHIWDICPISMSVVPFIKGNWPLWVEKAEKLGPGIYSDKLIKEIYADDTIYEIGQNKELVLFILDEIKKNHIYITFHAIHHRNEDEVIPQFINNFGVGAEFYTNRDLTAEVAKSIDYLEKLFLQKIEVFAPPQNLLSDKGKMAVLNNSLAIIGSYPKVKSIKTIKLLGLQQYIKYFVYLLINRSKKYPYPYPIINKNVRLVNHYSLQPGTDIDQLYKKLEYIYKKNGVFVLSTHSYGFNFKMKNSEITMGQVLKDIVDHLKTKPNVEFVSVNEIFN